MYFGVCMCTFDKYRGLICQALLFDMLFLILYIDPVTFLYLGIINRRIRVQKKILSLEYTETGKVMSMVKRFSPSPALISRLDEDSGSWGSESVFRFRSALSRRLPLFPPPNCDTTAELRAWGWQYSP